MAATVNHIVMFGWEHLGCAPYSPDLVPSDFHFFPTSKRALEGRRFTTNEDTEAAVWTKDTDLWDKCIDVGWAMFTISRLMPCSTHIGVYLV
jgi:hypothetical protein